MNGQVVELGRHTGLRNPCPPGVRVQGPPWSLSVALVVKRRSWLPPKEQVQVQLLAGVLFDCFDGERDITRPCEGRVPGSIPGWSTVAEPKAVAGPGCEPGL